MILSLVAIFIHMKYQEPICESCNSTIKINRPRDRFKRFCNRKCASYIRTQKRRTDRMCLHCNQEFQPRYSAQKYCSRSCSNRFRKKQHVRYCNSCKHKFILKNIAYENRGNGKFCSVSCAQRQYPINNAFFDIIDSEIQAYWLGFLFGDGYQNGYELVVNLAVKDYNHLFSLKRALDSKHPIKIIDGSIASIRIGSKHLCKALTKLGCVQAKSKTLKWPKTLKPHLQRHFIRGVFDADGCFYKQKSGRTKRWSIYSGSPEFLEVMAQVLAGHGMPTSINQCTINITKQKVLQHIYAFLYKKSTIYLPRKKEKFATYINSL